MAERGEKMTREERIFMYEGKKSFVFCQGCLFAAHPSVGVKKMQYGYDLDTGEEKVRIHFDGGAIQDIDVTADSIPAILQDILKVLG